MTATKSPPKFVLTLTAEEQEQLLCLLEESLREIHAEKRRTEAPAYQEKIQLQESLIRTLTEKVRRLRS